MVTEDRIVDCHAHIIDPVRFPFTGTKGYRARADEHGTREEFCAALDEHGVSNAVLIQLSGYGTDNSATAKFCANCGEKLQESAAPAAAPPEGTPPPEGKS